MRNQLSQNYKVDSRYRGLKNAQDDDRGLNFALDYLQSAKKKNKIPSDNEEVNRFTVSGPGDTVYSFLNGFRARQ
jgi:hypothetical protein